VLDYFAIFIMSFIHTLNKHVFGGPSLKYGVIDCCLTPTEQFFSNIMERTSYFQQNDDDVHFVLDLHAKYNHSLTCRRQLYLIMPQVNDLVLNNNHSLTVVSDNASS
jgi:hypothetical protein